MLLALQMEDRPMKVELQAWAHGKQATINLHPETEQDRQWLKNLRQTTFLEEEPVSCDKICLNVEKIG